MRAVLALMSAGLLYASGAWSQAWAQDAAANYPNRPIHIIVCVPAGGGVDTVTRIVADGLQKRLGQTVVVENKAGAAGNIGAEAVFTADPDGYTLLAAQPSPLTVNPLLYKNMAFDPTKFEPVAIMTTIANVLLVRPDFPAKTAQEFIAYAKANPGQDQLCLARDRHHLASDRGAVREGDRHQAGARALQGHRAGAQRAYRQPCRHDLHGARLGDQTAPGRQGAHILAVATVRAHRRTCPTSRRSTRPA